MPHMTTWEALDCRLEDTLSDYLDSCLALETATMNPHSKDVLLRKVGHRLSTFHTSLTQRLDHARSTLLRVQNRLATTVLCLPDEILVKIFRLTMNNTTSGEPTLLNHSVRAVYNCLHTLISVCSTWRRVGLSHGSLWSIIPLLDDAHADLIHDAVELTLSRAGNSELCLAGNLGSFVLGRLSITIEQISPRLGTVNLYGGDSDVIRDVVSTLLNGSSPGQITDLSICYSRPSSSDSPPDELDYLFDEDSWQQDRFAYYSPALRALRLRGLNLHWGTTLFEELVELRIQDVMIGPNSAIEGFLLAAASAPNLQILQIISIITQPDDDDASQDGSFESQFAVVFPNLHTLYLQDLYRDDLVTILRSVMPGSHRVVCNYTISGCFPINVPDDDEPWEGIDDLGLENQMVDMLMLTADSIDDWALDLLLKAMPSVKALYLDNYLLTFEALEALVHPSKFNRSGSVFPKLRTIYVSRSLAASISELKVLKDIVTSHGIQEMGLGGHLNVPANRGGLVPFHEAGVDEDMDSLVDWLKANVPKFTFVKDLGDLPEFDFRTDLWQLW